MPRKDQYVDGKRPYQPGDYGALTIHFVLNGRHLCGRPGARRVPSKRSNNLLKVTCHSCRAKIKFAFHENPPSPKYNSNKQKNRPAGYIRPEQRARANALFNSLREAGYRC